MADVPDGWRWLVNWLWPSLELRTWQIERRLHHLNRTIAQNPDAAPAYVLRGEIYLDGGFYDLAIADFTHALTLAQQHVQTSDWGVLSQAMQDRAQHGLQVARRRLKIR